MPTTITIEVPTLEELREIYDALVEMRDAAMQRAIVFFRDTGCRPDADWAICEALDPQLDRLADMIEGITGGAL